MRLFDIFKKKRNPDQSTETQQTDNTQQKNLDNIIPCDEPEASSIVDKAVRSLRKQIIAEITNNPAVEYQLSSLLWEAAASCFPKGGFQWDGAWFKLDLKTGKLLANVSTYPNQFGACYEDLISLSASEFNRIAKQYNMSPELQAFESDEDWDKLFDDNLKSAVSSACAILQKQQEERKAAETKRYSVKIPAKYTNRSPNMGLSEITIEISQRYSSRSIQVTNKNGKYQVVYVRISHTSPSVDRYPRVLSITEAVWLEKQVENTIKNPDDSTWQSLAGGDTMNIVIKRNNGTDVSLRGVKPIRKYSNLQDELENLAQYGYSIVEDNAFEGTLAIPKGTKEIKLSEYKDKKNIAQIILPEGVESINAQAFSGCENLETINFPKSLKFIGFSAFARCKKLKQVHLPEGLENIDNAAFFECINLEKINFPASLKRMGEHVFSACTKLKSAGPYGSGVSVEFGATDKLISGLFGSCNYLERVSLPEGLETIGSTVFRGCKYLAKINLPASLKKIGDQAFAGCEKLISAGPPNSGCSIEFSVTDRIPENMFMNCKNLNSVQLPAGITVIGESAFYNCKSLERITIPRGVEEIGARAFEFCGSLKHLVLPESVVKIGEGAFRGCDQLADHDGFIIIRSVLYGCLNLRDTITVPQGVTSIDSYAFVLGTSTYNDVTTTIVIPESVVSITHHRAFLRCKKLETVTIPENATDEVKEVAQVIADRAEERRRQQEKPKPVFIRTPDQLWVFRSANSSILSEEVYQAIISKFQEIRDKVIGKGGKTDVRWSESAIMISLYDEDSHWVGHDDTVTESIELKLERLSKWEEPSEWTLESDLPCKGAYLYLSKCCRPVKREVVK